MCVVSGIRFAFDLAFNLNLIDKEYKFLSDDLLKLFNYKKVPAYGINKIIKIMETDKKRPTNILYLYFQKNTVKFRNIISQQKN